jgi:hypothetical protein
MPRHRAGLNVAHLIASPREQPVKREKFRTQVSRVTTLGRSSVYIDCIYGKTQDVPSGERIGALEIQLDAFLYKPLAVAPLVNPVFEMGVQDLHGYE